MPPRWCRRCDELGRDIARPADSDKFPDLCKECEEFIMKSHYQIKKKREKKKKKRR